MNSEYGWYGYDWCGYDGAVVIERKIYVLGCETTSVEVYNVDQGIFMKYISHISQTRISDIF